MNDFIKINKDYLKVFISLSDSGLNVMLYMMDNMKSGNNRIYFDLDDCMKFCNYKNKSNVYRGINELLEKSIVSKIDRHYYFNDMYIKY